MLSLKLYCGFICICLCDINRIWFRKRKEGNLTHSYNKNPYINRKFENQWTTQKRHQKNLDYTTTVDRLRTVSWSNNSHRTGVVKPVYGYPTLPLTEKAVLSKGHKLKNVSNFPYRDSGPTTNQSGEVIKMRYTNMYSYIIVYKKYLVTSVRVGCATRSPYASSGPKA